MNKVNQYYKIKYEFLQKLLEYYHDKIKINKLTLHSNQIATYRNDVTNKQHLLSRMTTSDEPNLFEYCLKKDIIFYDNEKLSYHKTLYIMKKCIDNITKIINIKIILPVITANAYQQNIKNIPMVLLVIIAKYCHGFNVQCIACGKKIFLSLERLIRQYGKRLCVCCKLCKYYSNSLYKTQNIFKKTKQHHFFTKTLEIFYNESNTSIKPNALSKIKHTKDIYINMHHFIKNIQKHKYTNYLNKIKNLRNHLLTDISSNPQCKTYFSICKYFTSYLLKINETSKETILKNIKKDIYYNKSSIIRQNAIFTLIQYTNIINDIKEDLKKDLNKNINENISYQFIYNNHYYYSRLIHRIWTEWKKQIIK